MKQATRALLEYAATQSDAIGKFARRALELEATSPAKSESARKAACAMHAKRKRGASESHADSLRNAYEGACESHAERMHAADSSTAVGGLGGSRSQDLLEDKKENFSSSIQSFQTSKTTAREAPPASGATLAQEVYGDMDQDERSHEVLRQKRALAAAGIE